MRTEKMTGYFDVRQYTKNVEHRDRKFVDERSNITFNASFAIAELPELFKQGGQPDIFVRAYASKSERENAQAQNRQPIADRASVRFKIGANCRWFDKFGQSTTKPLNADLDDGQFEVLIDFTRKERNPNDDKAPCGYWANAVMYKRVAANPFEGRSLAEEGEEPDSAPVAHAPAQQAQQAQPAQPAQPAQAPVAGELKLPF